MASKKEGVERLVSVPLFSTLSKRDVARLWDGMRLVEHEPGDEIVVEGRSGRGFHLIMDGTVRVERKGTKVTLGAGDFFGEISLIDEGPRTATVTAVTPVTTASMSSWEFRTFTRDKPEILWKLLVHVTGRLREEQSARANLTA
jgi:CRP-like cAMP-binding protein